MQRCHAEQPVERLRRQSRRGCESRPDDGQGRYTSDMRMDSPEFHPHRQWRRRIVLGQNRYPDVERDRRCEFVLRYGMPYTHGLHSALCERFDSRAHRTRAVIQPMYLVQ